MTKTLPETAFERWLGEGHGKGRRAPCIRAGR